MSRPQKNKLPTDNMLMSIWPGTSTHYNSLSLVCPHCLLLTSHRFSPCRYRISRRRHHTSWHCTAYFLLKIRKSLISIREDFINYNCSVNNNCTNRLSNVQKDAYSSKENSSKADSTASSADSILNRLIRFLTPLNGFLSWYSCFLS